MNKQSIKKYLRKIIDKSQLLRKLIFQIRTKGCKHKYYVSNLDNIDAIDSIQSNIILPKRSSEVFKPIFWNIDASSELKEEADLDSTKLLTITDATVIGASNIIILNNKEALYNHSSQEDINHTDQALMDFKTTYHVNQETMVYYKETSNYVPKAISLCINYCFNYYHFIFECLSKFYLFEKTQIPNDIPILIDVNVKQIPQFSELLKIFNKDRRQVIFVNNLESIKVGTLFAFTPINYFPVNFIDFRSIGIKSFLFDTAALDFLRSILMKEIETPLHKEKKKIYISRTNYKNRDFNNDEISEMLSNQGFEIVYPERLSIKEQIQLFNQSEVIVGASGAALSNILFCEKDTKVIVLANQPLDLADFSSIAGHLGLKMINLTDQCDDPKNLHSSFYISPTKLQELLNTIASSGLKESN